MHLNPAIAELLEALNHPALPGIDLSLGRMLRLLEILGHPERKLPLVIHVAGTNGKGSTIAFLRAMLEANGKRVHAYTSPHLVRFNERILLAGQEIDDERLLPILQQVHRAVQQQAVTFFEATTVAAFLAFAACEADVLLLEVGMGGRLDATNVITPMATVITPIALDHQEYLGATLAQVAGEKAGIMKEGVPCIVAPQQPEAMAVIARQAAALGVTLWLAEQLPMPMVPSLAGEHQHANASLAMTVMHALDDDVKPESLTRAQWPGRLQRLTKGPLVAAWGAPVWLDGAHNEHAARALAHWIRAQNTPMVMVCGLMARKDATAFFAALKGAVLHVVTVPIAGHGDAQAAEILAGQAREAGLDASASTSPLAALETLKRYKPATVLVAGSLYLVGALLKDHE